MAITRRPITTDDAIAYLTAHEFTPVQGTTWYRHRNGRARVVVEDPEARCPSRSTPSEPPAPKHRVWQATLTGAPVDVFTATVTAAIS